MVEIIDGFEEYRGRIDLERIYCPHCESVQGIGAPCRFPNGEAGTYQCFECDKSFLVLVMETPLGMAWQTWDRDPRPQHTIDSQADKP